MNENAKRLKSQVYTAAGELVTEKGYVCPVDLLLKLGRLKPEDHLNWRHGRVPYLEKMIEGNLSKCNRILRFLKQFALEAKLQPRQTVYKRWGKGPKTTLVFSKYRSPAMERIYSTHWVRK
jgi:hypothetical protein